MRSITTLIVDDEGPSRRAIRHQLEKDAEIVIVGEASDGEAAVKAIEKLRPKLVFLDVQMPMLDGMEVLQRLPATSQPAIIFVTAYENYAKAAFDVDAVDYVVKPFTADRFALALDRSKKRIMDDSLRGAEVAVRTLLNHLQGTIAAPEDQTVASTRIHSKLIVKSEGQLHFLSQQDVRWIEAQGDYIKVHLRRKSLLVRMTMGKMASLLDPKHFVRVHKSSIVNLDSVKELRAIMSASRGMVLDDGTIVPIGVSYRSGVTKAMRWD
jgi:two-component system, LytTR family, response regulator